MGGDWGRRLSRQAIVTQQATPTRSPTFSDSVSRALVSALRTSVVVRWLAVFVRVCLFVRVYRIFYKLCPLEGDQQRLTTQLRHDGGNSDQIGGICDHHHHHFTNLRLPAEVLRNIPLPAVLQNRTWNRQACGIGKY